MFGSGTLSSSDGQRFPTRGKSITARHLNKYFVSEGISTYTHVSGQHSTFGEQALDAGRPLLAAAQDASKIRGDLTLERIFDMIVAIARIHGSPDYLEPR